MHKTAATPLAAIYVVLVVYASLSPFSGWRDQGIALGSFLLAPMPRYWTWFDIWINVVGYMPLGGLLTLSALRSGRVRFPVLLPCVFASGLSLVMETTQSFIPVRVASREDWLLNSAGALLGAVATMVLERLGAIDRWSQFRERWFVEKSRGGLVLLLTWPLALLFPPAVPFGLGQVYERMEAQVALLLSGTPFLDWLPVPDIELQPLLPSAELLCVFMGLLIPCLLSFCVTRAGLRRVWFALGLLLLGMLVAGLSALLSWGPDHAWSWIDAPTRLAMLLVLVLAPLLAALPTRASAALLLLLLGVYLTLLNQAPASAYFTLTLQDWEQGQFIRFHGLAQWLGWLWPYATLLYVLARVWSGDVKN